MPGATRYLAALALTLAVEAPLYSLMLRALVGTRPRAGLLSGGGVNAVSHPAAFLLVVPLLLPAAGYAAALGAAEGLAVASEAALLWGGLRRDACILLAVSALANAASFSVGLLLIR